MQGEKKRLGEILIAQGWLEQGDLDAALAEQSRHAGRLGALLVEKGILHAGFFSRQFDHAQSTRCGHGDLDHPHGGGFDCIRRRDQLLRRLGPHDCDHTCISNDIQFFVLFHGSLPMKCWKGYSKIGFTNF